MKSIEIKGLDKLINKLKNVADDNLIDKGILRTAEFVQGQAKLNAPVDTGDLRESIKVSDIKNHTAEVFTNSDHAIFNEYGTGSKGDPDVSHTTKKNWTYKGTDGNFHTTSGMKPHPYMRPAAHEGEKQMPCIFDALIKKELEK